MLLTCAAVFQHTLAHSWPKHDVSGSFFFLFFTFIDAHVSCVDLLEHIVSEAGRNYDFFFFSFEEHSIHFAQLISVIPKLPHSLWAVFFCHQATQPELLSPAV